MFPKAQSTAEQMEQASVAEASTTSVYVGVPGIHQPLAHGAYK